MNLRTQIRRISAKRLAELGGKMPFSTITPRLKFPRKGKPRSTRAGAGLHRSSRRLNRLPEWTDPHSYITKGGRHRLSGEDYQRLRLAAYQRARGDGMTAICECGCGRFATWGAHMSLAAKGELSHKRHGARKSDELTEVLWTRHECHMNSHNCGGKPIMVTKKSLKVPA